MEEFLAAHSPEQCRKGPVGNRIAHDCARGKSQHASQHPLEPKTCSNICAFSIHKQSLFFSYSFDRHTAYQARLSRVIRRIPDWSGSFTGRFVAGE